MRPASATARAEGLERTRRRAVVRSVMVAKWEYLIVALPRFEAPTAMPAASAAIAALNREGQDGWEAVGMTALEDGTIAVLLKRPQTD